MPRGAQEKLAVALLALTGAGELAAQEPTNDLAEAVVAAHNRLREAHCSPPLVWSDEVAAQARGWIEELAGNCQARPARSFDYGSNTAWHSDAFDFTADEIVGSWYGEIESYDFEQPGFNARAGHFTQLIWAGTTEVGCAFDVCGDEAVWVCYYSRPGNELGEFPTNVQPLGCGEAETEVDEEAPLDDEPEPEPAVVPPPIE